MSESRGSEEREAKALKRNAEEMVATVRKGGRGKEKEHMNQLVVILAKLALQGAQELRELCGVMYHTFLIKNENCNYLKAMLQAGEEYNEKAKSMKERREKGEEIDMASLGPPFVRYCNEKLANQSMDEVALEERLCRAKRLRPKEAQKSKFMARVQVAFINKELEASFLKIMKSAGHK